MIPYSTYYYVIYVVGPTLIPPRNAGQDGASKRKIGQYLKRCTEHRACFAASPFRAVAECCLLETCKAGLFFSFPKLLVCRGQNTAALPKVALQSKHGPNEECERHLLGNQWPGLGASGKGSVLLKLRILDCYLINHKIFGRSRWVIELLTMTSSEARAGSARTRVVSTHPSTMHS